MDNQTKELLYGLMSVLGGILLHFTYGIFYSVANIAPYIISYINANVNTNIHTSQGAFMCIVGFLNKKHDPRIAIAFSSLFTSGGVTLTYFTIQYTFAGVIFTFACLLGVGIGLGYAVVFAAVIPWFPNRRGLVVGLIVCGYGLSASFFTPIQTSFINPTNIKVNNTTKLFTNTELLNRVPNVFLILGGILFALQCIGMLLLRVKSANTPESNKLTEEEVEKAPPLPVATINLSARETLHCLDFYLLWIVMLCHSIPIQLIVSASKIFGQRYIADDRYLSVVLMVASLCNCFGRIAWGALVDRISFKVPLCILLTVWSGVLITFPHIAFRQDITLKVLYAIWVCLLFLSVSGVFAIMPAATTILFGQVNLVINYGMIFTAFTIGSVVSVVSNLYFKAKDVYTFQFTLSGCICLVALFTTLWISDKKIPNKINICALFVQQCKSIRGPSARTA